MESGFQKAGSLQPGLLTKEGGRQGKEGAEKDSEGKRCREEQQEGEREERKKEENLAKHMLASMET